MKNLSHILRSYTSEALFAAVIVGAMFLLPQSHFGYSTRILDMGDEGLLWYVSQRTELGDVPLRDSFSYDPGRYYWSAVVFKVLRADGLFEQIIADDLFGLVGVFLVYFLMSRLAIDRKWRIATILLLGVALGFPRHKIYEQTLSLVLVAAVTVALGKPSRRNWFYYGIATGIAAFVGRNSGVYFALAAMLSLGTLKLRQSSVSVRSLLGTYIFGGVVGYLPMLVMLVSIRGFPEAFERSILLNSKQLIPIPVPFPWRLHALGYVGLQPIAVSILFMVVPAAYAVLVLLMRPRVIQPAFPSNESMLAYGASIAGIPYLFHAFSYASFGHLAQASMPFIVASVAVSAYLSKTVNRWSAVLVMLSVTALVLACWIPREPALEYFRARDRFKPIEIQGTQFELLKEDVDVLSTSQDAFRDCGAKAGSFLASPNYPSSYAFLRTRSPFWEVYFIFLRLPRSEEAQANHIESLIRNQTTLIQLNNGDKRGMRVVYPKLLDYILSHYQLVKTATPLEGFEMYYMPQLCSEVKNARRESP